MSNEITIIVHVRTDKIGSRCERELTFDREEWNDMDAKERDEAMRDAMFEMIEWGYEVQS